VIATHILIQAEAGTADIATAALRGLPGVSETASIAGPPDVTAGRDARRRRAGQARDPRARAHGGGVVDSGLPDVQP
jgi:hypothetical protein